ncbi:oxygenase MpaB family protein [Kibdelosporangium aridum]|uniref:oxygenase MpaB family protein n=1 Tax=Kibdelosporangium aridum TaxID=2030 RepID=UPI000689ABF6
MIVGSAFGPAVGAPSRFLADPKWARAAAAPLAPFIRGTSEPTRDELEVIARGLRAEDEQGRGLAEAIHRGDVTFAQFRRVLAQQHSDEDIPTPLAEFFRHVEQRPDWVDDARLQEGARVMRQFGPNLVDVLNGALLSGYRSSADAELLARTGRLTKDPVRRLGETMKWVIECVRDGGLDRDQQGWQLTVHVRAMHALVNHRFRTRGGWDEDVHGLPINQADQGATLGLHCTYYLLGARMLGMPITRAQGDAVMHLWRYIGWLMGVADYWLPLDEQDGRRKFYHLSLTAPPPSDNSRLLAAALDRSRQELTFPQFQALRRRWELAKFRSLSRVLAGGAAMRELGLPFALPWYHVLRIPVNLVKHGLVARVPGGRAWLLRRSERQLDRLLSYHFGDKRAAVARHEDA